MQRRAGTIELGDLRAGVLRALGWRGLLALAATAALVVAAVVAAASLFLVLLPIFALAALAARLIWGRRKPPAGPLVPDVIEGSYEVVDERPPQPGSGRGWRPR